MTIVGLDIGGANLKAADGRGRAAQIPFALWKTPDRLAGALRGLLDSFGALDGLAITMTGELCDCFESKEVGVRHILRSAIEAAPRAPLRVWTVLGEFLAPEQVDREPLCAAAANWLALATYAARFASRNNAAVYPQRSVSKWDGSPDPSKTGQASYPTSEGLPDLALVTDLGSTTCDLVLVRDGHPRPIGRTDSERLASGELVYCGVRRTPLCAVFGLTKAAEWFATTEDVYVVLGDLPEEPDRIDTADGRPVTRQFAKARLARMECADAETWTLEKTHAFAEHARTIQVRRLADAVIAAVRRMDGPIAGVVLAGAGEFLLPAVLQAAGLDSIPTVSLAAQLGPDVSVAACAHAVATLAAEMP